MTTKVTVSACCNQNDTQVEVIVSSNGSPIGRQLIQHGENAEFFVHGCNSIHVKEIEKAVSDAPDPEGSDSEPEKGEDGGQASGEEVGHVEGDASADLANDAPSEDKQGFGGTGMGGRKLPPQNDR